jgi:hypothetical protein
MATTAPNLFLGGIFNKMVFGIPYYIWIVVAMLIIGIMAFGMWYFFFWWKLKPYHGIFWAHIRKMGASLVFDENMHFDLITERSSKVIFNETFKQAQEAEEDRTEAPTASIGSVRTDFVFDPDKWTYPGSYQRKIIEDIAESWNSLNPTDQVRTFLKFGRYMKEGKFDADYANQLKNIKREYIVPWARITMMYRDREESQTFGFIMSLAQTIEKIEQDNLNRYALVVLGFFFLIDVILIAAHYIGK